MVIAQLVGKKLDLVKNQLQSVNLFKISSAVLESHLSQIGKSCVYCGGEYKHLDHIVALNKGGKHILSNLVPSCENCNESKQDKDWLTWFEKRESFSNERVSVILSILYQQAQKDNA